MRVLSIEVVLDTVSCGEGIHSAVKSPVPCLREAPPKTNVCRAVAGNADAAASVRLSMALRLPEE